MKILLLGKDGQVGHELQRTLLPQGKLTAVGRAQIDLGDTLRLEQLLHDLRPDIVVNAAAYTAVDKAETDFARARAVNCTAVETMAKYTACENALLVHYSTDYVFDGRKAGAYVEEDAPNPQSVYGATKLAGEHAIRQQGGKALVFRTSWVFSFYGANFVKTIVRLAQERDHLDIISDQVGAPTSAELIADITALALSANRCGALPFGVYHLCAGGEASWYDFARYIVTELWARKTLLKLTVAGIRPIDTESYPLPAKRPKNSRLNTNKLGNALGLEKMPDWTLYVDRTLDQLI